MENEGDDDPFARMLLNQNAQSQSLHRANVNPSQFTENQMNCKKKIFIL